MFGFLSREKREKLLEYSFVKMFIKEFSKKRVFFNNLHKKKSQREFYKQLQIFTEELKTEGFTEQEIFAIGNIYSQTQKIYLTRHGKTLRNVFVEESAHPKKMQLSEQIENDLSDKGISQACTLGRYLREIIPVSADVLFLTSELSRTKDTASLIAEHSGIHFKTEASSLLNDMIPDEHIPKLESPGFKKWYERATAEGIIMPQKDIGKKVFAEVLRICKANKEKTIFAALHEAVNAGLLAEAGYPPGKDYKKVENCSLVVLERSGNHMSVVLKYISNDDMNKILS